MPSQPVQLYQGSEGGGGGGGDAKTDLLDLGRLKIESCQGHK